MQVSRRATLRLSATGVGWRFRSRVTPVSRSPSLASGFLSGKYCKNRALPTSERLPDVQKLSMNERGYAILDELDRVAANYDASVAQIALAWIMARPSVTAPIAGATSVKPLEELVGATRISLDAESMAALNAASTWR